MLNSHYYDLIVLYFNLIIKFNLILKFLKSNFSIVKKIMNLIYFQINQIFIKQFVIMHFKTNYQYN